MFTQIEFYLDMADSDYWYDEGCEIPRSIIDENIDDIFPWLLQEWFKWSENAQEHLAYILGEGESDLELKLIKEMLHSEYESVVYRAKEALVEFNQQT